MAISVNWITGEIFIPQADLTPPVLSGSLVYELDVDTFRLALKDLEASVDGMPWPRTHDHDTESTIGGVIYIRKISVIPPYFITFEAGAYAVKLLGANNNIQDVATINGVSIFPTNSAGLQKVTSGSGVLAQDVSDIATAVWNEPVESTQKAKGFLRLILATLLGKGDKDTVPGQVDYYSPITDTTKRATVPYSSGNRSTPTTLDGDS